MDVILVPGFWLRGDSWDEVVPIVEAAGHRAHPLTRPGLRPGDDPASVTLADQVDGAVPLPDWALFDGADLRDLDDAGRERFAARAVPEPLTTARSPQVLHDERRRSIPSTVIATSRSEAEYREWFESPIVTALG